MKKIFPLLLTLAGIAPGYSLGADLAGFYYGNDLAPKGHEWESPDSLSYNKEQPRATFWAFQDLESAKGVLPENSRYWKSLDGNWKFHWAPTPQERPIDFYREGFDASGWDEIKVPSNWNIEGIGKDGSKKYGTPIYVNQPVIFWHQVKPDDWRGGVMRTPPENWTTYKDRNEVGSYLRSFEVPADWKDREVYINFDGVDSFFYLWINGKYVGFSKNSRNAARFNITKYLVKGENTVAVEVYRSSDGSFLEAQDMFRLPGIFRSVALYSTPQIQIRDLKVIPDLTEDYKDGSLVITSTIRNLSGKNSSDLKVEYHLYANKLYSDDHETGKTETQSSEFLKVAKDSESEITTVMNVENPNKWSAELPWRYTLVAQLKDKKGNVLETVSTYVGFRKVEILDTPAEKDEFGLKGRYFYVNGKPVKLKGVNRHETNPSTGHYVDHSRMEEEVMMMKRANINHVRNSHYPDDPYWYYLTDKYGIYLEDEANLESHEYYYGDASLSHVPEWEAAHVARDMEMVHSRINSPSVVIWSLGNEAGPGKNFIAAYNAIKEFDTSRPVQYERNNDIVDMGSNQYPSIPWVREAVLGEMNIKYPFHISEYAHSMGNAVGNLVDYWEAMESTNHFMGGAIWDWIDQSLYNYDPSTGDRYLAFGGDFGDTPSDGQFVMNGIIFGDLQPKPQYWEVKKVYQNVGVTPSDIKNGEIEIFNKNYFIPLDGYEVEWTLFEDGNKVAGGTLSPDVTAIGPREKKKIKLPIGNISFNDQNEYFINIDFKLAEDMPWAEAGYVQMNEQLPLTSPGEGIAVETVELPDLKLNAADSINTISGEGFTAVFDNSRGTLSELKYGGKDMIVPGKGPELDVFRAVLNNDIWTWDQWFTNGLYNMQPKVTNQEIFTDDNGNMILSYVIESQAPNGGKMVGGNGNSTGSYSIDETGAQPFGEEDFKIFTNQIWTVYKDGTIELNAYFDSNKPTLTLPRLGYSLEVPKQFDKVTYYGRGPEENYADRKTGQFIGTYSNTVEGMTTDYTRPQSNGNREEVRWAQISDGKDGILFVAPELMSFSASPYSEMEIFEANHPYKLPASTTNKIHIDYGVTGLGGASCGQGGPLPQDRVHASENRFSFIIRNTGADNPGVKAKVKSGGVMPLGISRDRLGMLSINYPSDDEILYAINGAKSPQTYKEPFNLKNGGSVKAWLKSNPKVYAEASFPKIDVVPTLVVYASSQEPDYGEASNMTDGNPASIWHTMYSVTVAQYPHWVDFDAGESKEIKGVTYLPRQDRNNTGTVKEYEIYVSDSLDDMGAPVAKGEFSEGKNKKTVTFDKPVKGRYVRFKALNAQDGREYASGAEFEVLAD